VKRTTLADGLGGVRRVLLALDTLANECEKRAATEPALAEVAAQARAQQATLAEAQQSRLSLIAQLAATRAALVLAYDAATGTLPRLQARIFGIYGPDPVTLGAFGLRASRIHVRKRTGTGDRIPAKEVSP
jgi:hypothetical protein